MITELLRPTDGDPSLSILIRKKQLAAILAYLLTPEYNAPWMEGLQRDQGIELSDRLLAIFGKFNDKLPTIIIEIEPEEDELKEPADRDPVQAWAEEKALTSDYRQTDAILFRRRFPDDESASEAWKQMEESPWFPMDFLEKVQRFAGTCAVLLPEEKRPAWQKNSEKNSDE